MNDKYERIHKLNEIALSAYVTAHCAGTRRMSDPRSQGLHINRIVIGMVLGETEEMTRMYDQDLKDGLAHLGADEPVVTEMKPRNFRPEKV